MKILHIKIRGISYLFFTTSNIALNAIYFNTQYDGDMSGAIVILLLSMFVVSLIFLVYPDITPNNLDKFGISNFKIFSYLYQRNITYYLPLLLVGMTFILSSPYTLNKVLFALIYLNVFLSIGSILILWTILGNYLRVFKILHQIVLSFLIAFVPVTQFFPNLGFRRDGRLMFDVQAIDRLIYEQPGISLFFLILLIVLVQVTAYNVIPFVTRRFSVIKVRGYER